jgi:hypothetical protein
VIYGPPVLWTELNLSLVMAMMNLRSLDFMIIWDTTGAINWWRKTLYHQVTGSLFVFYIRTKNTTKFSMGQVQVMPITQWFWNVSSFVVYLKGWWYVEMTELEVYSTL